MGGFVSIGNSRAKVYPQTDSGVNSPEVPWPQGIRASSCRWVAARSQPSGAGLRALNCARVHGRMISCMVGDKVFP